MTAKGKLPMTKEALEDLLEKEKRAVKSRLECLKSHDEYRSKETYDAIEYLRETCWLFIKNESYKRIASKLVNLMLEQGFSHLIVKIIGSGKTSYEFRHKLGVIISRLTNHVVLPKIAGRVRVDLCASGMIQALVKELDLQDPYTMDSKQRALITNILFLLHNLHLTPKAMEIYRAANAAKVLMRFTEASDVMTINDSLPLLAFVANEEESQRIAATSGESIATMLDILQKAALSHNRKYAFAIQTEDKTKNKFYITLRSQAESVNELAGNDTIKEAIVQHGGLPILTSILKPQYSDDVKQEVIEALNKLSSLEKSRDAILTHLAFNDESKDTDILHDAVGDLWTLSSLDSGRDAVRTHLASRVDDDPGILQGELKGKLTLNSSFHNVV